MGLFDSIGRMFGFGASQAQQQTENPEQKFANLKGKYVAALNYADSVNARVDALYVEGDKLIVRIAAPDQGSAEQITNQFNSIDNSYGDLDLQVSGDQPQAEQASDQQAAQTYTVQSGDSLWKIAKHHYGDGAQYMQIYYANRDKIQDPDKINVGWELSIPNANQTNA
ncbi:MAG: LysM peptidoglycan-binding domain-containing protein [Pyrinomonadaceae bacterium]